MLILSIDTTGRAGAVALARGDASACEIIASSPLEGGTYSAQLAPTIAALLERNRLKLAGLNGIAVAHGPGSFTGLRVGLAAVKALAEIIRVPIAAVSLLEALALAAQRRAAEPGVYSQIMAALDAGRSEFYVAEYRVHGNRAELQRQFVAHCEEFIAAVRGQARAGAGPVVTPDDAVAQAAGTAGLHLERVPRPSVADVARIGLRKLAAGETVSAADLDAEYIRRSDAEIFAKP
ncbi:MAG TPA: tRNA (adenosine(37)-N6)-threonylcarbamoyltransferase complex dimerization subunit type 1 TsaB [Terriglobales bacterium]|nr:tRNA (adenosine(37)-N6)-threonylcarbamoyltransferase complex dimerization subunit type 1 TsaB [Terriglobales bacterium]